jgi:S-ribosylhomocysteine lyase LuxS involved in autoinducer biosynthesis
MVPLIVEQVQELTKISVQRAIWYLESGETEHEDDFQWIPFAREISCGQYDFHDKQKAINDLKKVDIEHLEIQADTHNTEHKTAYVCDLRFLKPKTNWWDNMIMFSADFSYKLSKLIEEYLPNQLSWSIALVWTFGCMTGMYLCISSAIWDESDIKHIHAMIIKILRENIDIATLWEQEKTQFQALLENYEKCWN